MPDTRQLLRETRDRIAPPPDVHGGLERRRRHRDNVKRAAAAVVGIAVALVGIGGWLLLEREAARRPAEPPQELGIFAPVAGRIVYVNEGTDLGYGPGLWAIDPSGPTDTTAGPSVADDVASTLVRLDLEDATPLGWSSDGTELLFMRSEGEDFLFPEQYLYILHTDGSETQLNRDPMYFGGAAISADGSRVVFAAWGDDLGLYVVDAEGGRPVPIPLPGAEGIVMSPTISPDGTRIAYLDSGNRENHVWVMDADGGNAREILANEVTQVGGVGDLQWSPAGDRIAGVARSSDGDNAIYTFAPDGSDFTRVITGGMSPYWSPDGSRIAFTIECELTDPSCGGLAIADADGSNVREFGFATSGPWHPGVSAADEPVPTPTPVETDDTVPADGEVLGFTGGPEGEPGDLVAVDPRTGATRVLVTDLAYVDSARLSADRRWVAYQDETGQWVAGPGQEPRPVAASKFPPWPWSPTGARLAIVHGSRLSVLDLDSDRTIDLGRVTGDVSAPVWSPDGTRLVYGARGGTLTSVDIGSREHSILVRLPGEELDSIDEIDWSPDGTHLAILYDIEPGMRRLYLMDANGSDVRVLLDDVDFAWMAWSPDGARLAYIDYAGAAMRIFTQTTDGAAPILVGEADVGCPEADFSPCGSPVWSPDGSLIAWQGSGSYASTGDIDRRFFVVNADGTGNVGSIDGMTVASWNGGSFPDGSYP